MKLVDIYAVTDTVVSGLGRVDILQGGWARFIWYVERKNDDGTTENVIISSMVMAIDIIPENRRITDAALNLGRAELAIEAVSCVH